MFHLSKCRQNGCSNVRPTALAELAQASGPAIFRGVCFYGGHQTLDNGVSPGFCAGTAHLGSQSPWLRQLEGLTISNNGSSRTARGKLLIGKLSHVPWRDSASGRDGQPKGIAHWTIPHLHRFNQLVLLPYFCNLPFGFHSRSRMVWWNFSPLSSLILVSWYLPYASWGALSVDSSSWC